MRRERKLTLGNCLFLFSISELFAKSEKCWGKGLENRKGVKTAIRNIRKQQQINKKLL